jgi:hypothetical protein
MIALEVCVIVLAAVVVACGLAAVAEFPLIAARRRHPRAAAPRRPASSHDASGSSAGPRWPASYIVD